MDTRGKAPRAVVPSSNLPSIFHHNQFSPRGAARAYLSARAHSLKSALLSVAAHMEVDAHAVAPDEGKTSRPGPARAGDCVTAGTKPTGTFELGDSKRPRASKGFGFSRICGASPGRGAHIMLRPRAARARAAGARDCGVARGTAAGLGRAAAAALAACAAAAASSRCVLSSSSIWVVRAGDALAHFGLGTMKPCGIGLHWPANWCAADGPSGTRATSLISAVVLSRHAWSSTGSVVCSISGGSSTIS